MTKQCPGVIEQRNFIIEGKFQDELGSVMGFYGVYL